MSIEPSRGVVHVIGGGIAGIHCAWHLHRRSIPFRLYEASDGLGGRMRSDQVDGFRLDRGFQVFQSAYPEAKASLNYAELDLVPLKAGALVRKNAKWIPMVDPIRHPRFALSTTFNSIGNLSDRLKLIRMLWAARRSPLISLVGQGQDKPTFELLTEDYAFSKSFVESFLRPWLSGIFLETELATSANFFGFVLKMLAAGRICYPRTGIQAIPDQLAGSLPPQSIELNRPVRTVKPGVIEFESGPRDASQIVLAVPMHNADRMTGQQIQDRGSVMTTCIYFAADRPPIVEPILMLNGESDGIVNHTFVMTNATPAIAPAGKSLISVSLVGDTEYDRGSVQSQLQNWYGRQVLDWTELAVYRIPHALPKQPPNFATHSPTRQLDDMIVCGDYCASASLNGALQSGRIAAEKVASH